MPIHTFRRLFSQQNKASSSNICERQGVFKAIFLKLILVCVRYKLSNLDVLIKKEKNVH